MPVVGRLDQYASMLAYEFDETTVNNPSINASGTYYASEFDENTPDIVRGGLILNLDAGNLSSYSGSGTTWNDESGNSNNGTLTNGPTYSSSNGGYIIFDGTDDYVSVPHNTALNPSLSMTLSAWINVQSFVINMSIFGKGSDVAGQAGYDFRINVNNQLNLVKYNVTDQTITLSTPLSANTWYNICAVQSNTGVQYFVNGVSVGSFANSSAYQTPISEFRVARNRNTIYTPASIANVSFYNRELTEAEVKQNYNALATRFGLSTFDSIPEITANVFTPYDHVYDEFGGTLFGAGQGTYMRHYINKKVIVYNEIDEITPIETTVPTTGLQLNIDPAQSTVSANIPVGQAEYTTAGTFNFTVPGGVTSISAVAVGGGGGGAGADSGQNRGQTNGGGGGGGLAYGTIAVTPGEILTVTVGAGGGSAADGNGTNGGTTTISRGATVLLSGGGGSGGTFRGAGGAGGASGGTARIGGGSGGSGGPFDGATSGASGAGGAGGYSGNGGNGGGRDSAGSAGTGGGGGGGGGYGTTSNTLRAGGGGGVGIFGDTGVSGIGGATNGGGGDGGSGGGAGGGNTTGLGGQYGGGGGGKADSSAGTNTPGGSGTGGAVRIIWGSNRSYPSTSVANATTVNYIVSLSDLSGNGRTTSSVNGTVFNTSLNQGILIYDGIDEYMTVTSYKGVTGTAARTSIVWFKSNAPNTFDRIMGWGATTAAGNKWGMEPDSTTFKLHLSTSNGAYAVGGSTTPNIMDGNWHMIAASVGASQTVNDTKLYVDGDLLTDVTRALGATAINTSSGSDVSFGASLADVSPEYLNGYTSQVLIYNVQLTDLDIRTIYRRILNRF